ncbi:electron transfer flavoprotein subunit alpha/FixB family protein [[Clostridium] hylemonae]|uniref:electron transfer flavoprotein subunit alpha/FixB family protein n=1 Tax=[Clostridium] hylemonae TaxID=89153 RepID=UPI001105D77A|nr:electron transfer flavoprotein subunit alpha/FixB family protein [[Clostridium] hylemonae]
MKNKIMIYLDQEYPNESAQLLEIIEKAYNKNEMITYAAGWVEEKQVPCWFDHLLLLPPDERSRYDARWMASVLEQMCREHEFCCVIIPSTWTGRMLAPLLAVKLESGLTADITDIETLDDKLLMIRPAFSGKVMAKIISKDSQVIMMSARLGAFSYTGLQQKKMQTEPYLFQEPIRSGIRQLGREDKKQTADIREAEVLISGGGGVGRRFDQLYPLSKRLNAMVSASRKSVDSGMASRSIQVGQSGKIVSPQLYIALGIYGSMQHIEGLKDIPYIISVNINKNAPICSLSDIVVEGDAIEFVTKLLERIKKE